MIRSASASFAWRHRFHAVPAALLLLGALACATGSRARAATWFVAPDGSGDYTIIQDAVDACSFGDTIRVAAGTYMESVDLRGQVLTLIGDAGAASTIVDAGGLGSVLKIPFTSGGATIVRGFTFTNGNGTILRASARQERYGGGIFVELAFPRIEDCRFTGNTANYGGGVFVIGGGPHFVRCTIEGNSSGHGGGVAVDNDGGVLLSECEISGNDAVFGGGIASNRGRIRLDRCSVTANRAFSGGGVRVVDAGSIPVRIDGCLISGNGGDIGGAIHAWFGFLEVESTTIADNDIVQSVALYMESSQVTLESTIVASRIGGGLIACFGGAPVLRCVDLWPSPPAPGSCTDGETVQIADPLFCDPDAGDYSLRFDSPCRPGEGPPGCLLIGAFDTGCDAPVAARPVTWGALKAVFR